MRGKMIIYKNWLIKLFCLTLFLLILTSIFNYAIDSANLWHTSEIEMVAKNISNGKKVAGLENYDERLLQKAIIENFKAKIDIAVIGSSRTMQLRKSYFKTDNHIFFNNSVSGTSIQDLFAIVGLYEHKGYLPKQIILCVDPWLFNINNNQNRWKSISDYYDIALSKITNKKYTPPNLFLDKFLQLINLDYTINNINFLFKKEKERFYVTNNTNIDSSIIDTDGSRYFPYKERFAVDSDIISAAKTYISGKVFAVEDFNKLSNIEIFEMYIKYLEKRNVKITIFLAPYNPIVYDFFINNPKYSNVFKAENYIREYSKKNNILVIGSYNPYKFNLKNYDFIDGMHCKDSAFKKIFSVNKKVK